MTALIKHITALCVAVLIIVTCTYISMRQSNKWIYRIQETQEGKVYVSTIVTRNRNENGNKNTLTRCNLYKKGFIFNKLIFSNYVCPKWAEGTEPYPQISISKNDIYVLDKNILYKVSGANKKIIVGKHVRYFVLKKRLLVIITHYGILPIFGEANPKKTYLPDIIVFDLSKNDRVLYKETIMAEKPEISPDGKYIAFSYKYDNDDNGTRIIDAYTGNIVTVILHADECSWYDKVNILCREYLIELHENPKFIIDYDRKYNIKTSRYGITRLTKCISIFNIKTRSKKVLIKTDYNAEELTYPMRFGRKIVYFRPATHSLWLYDIENKTNERVGYNINSSETLPTQSGRLAVSFNMNEEPREFPESLGMFKKIKRLLIRRRSGVVVVDPENIREPIR